MLMADSFSTKTAQDDDNEDEDYMGDLSQFIPPETAQPPKAQFKKVLPINPNSPLFGSQENVFVLFTFLIVWFPPKCWKILLKLRDVYFHLA